MARSFSRAGAGEAVADFYNKASDTHYSMSERDSRLYQRRWQIGFDGAPINVEELPADFVMGSGNHARTYLTKTNRGTLVQLPLGWYSERGGYWGMNPGYDTLHPPSHRPIGYECMFCHNSYPDVPVIQANSSDEPVYGGSIPGGIDCQRCHGPGAAHVTAARARPVQEKAVRAAIVNPAKLDKERRMEVCMQCHLETASTRLPSLVRRFGRGPFSFAPGEPLGNFVISFDHAPDRGYDDKFDIAGAAYRFRQSRCFLASKGEMTCTTCHDPHRTPRGVEAAAHYNRVCRECHGASVQRLTAIGAHSGNEDCVTCHMPKRRTDDAVHVVMTDHLIQRRRPDRDLLADRQEIHLPPADEYRGPVVPYYPAALPPTSNNAFYVALAQVRDGSNLIEGITQLTAALTRVAKPRADFYMALGDAWHRAGDPAKAVVAYRRAASLQPDSTRAARYLGIALHEAHEPLRAIDSLEHALQLSPGDTGAWSELASIASDEGRPTDALAALRQVIARDPDLPEVWNGLAVNLSAMGNAGEAEDAYRHALRLDPYNATVNGNIARMLADRNDLLQAVYHFDKAVRLGPSQAANHYEYALVLVRLNRFEDSQREAEAASRVDPNLAEAHELLGGLLARSGNLKAAVAEYREAVRLKPAWSRAQLDLGATLLTLGEGGEASVHLREAAKSSDPRISAGAQALMQSGPKR